MNPHGGALLAKRLHSTAVCTTMMTTLIVESVLTDG